MTEEASTGKAAKPQRKWHQFRWRVLLVVPLAAAVLVAFYGPRQYAQRQAIVAMASLNAVVRTEPVPLPLLADLAGEQYAMELTEVYLRNPRAGDNDLEVLDGLTSLTRLELGQTNITSAGLRHLRRSTGLYTLHLSDTKVTDEGLSHLAALSNLGILSLNNTPVTDNGVAKLASLSQLERLFLDGTQVGDDGLAAIGQLSNLKELSLNGTRITDAGLQHLKPLKNLELLKLTGTDVSQEAISDLLRILPSCRVLTPGGDE